MELITLLKQQPLLFVALTAVAGLAVGSFLNVVIHRLPRMMETRWKRECREYLGLPQENDGPQANYNLLTPGSHCPNCGAAVRAIHNIPLLSYLALRGRCSSCGAAIAWRYPLIELLTAVLSAAVAWRYGYGEQALCALLFTWALLSLALIDLEHQLLPDAIVLPLLWLGLLLSLGNVFVDSHAAIAAAAAGYLSLWGVYHLFRLATGKEGMGYGDFKLLAALGAWTGWTMLPLIILLSSLVGAVAGIALILLRGRDRNVPMPFGPFLAAAGWIALLWGQSILDIYLR
ncbi:prepilin peptidase [Methylogaea oryzae]|uniref:Prepilin leader peptidase/N-methyltransferase n=1 Tax=Methylogaea oryzae TaxID=1295382 RepID=A0A8D4VTU2_9GAMM|nr:A24 family peptidase [Methylogaea oryzae]BBL72190.1 type 4 prepilin-like proteins leader peptide-processing enzyme [Methylogaea oryzae]